MDATAIVLFIALPIAVSVVGIAVGESARAELKRAKKVRHPSDVLADELTADPAAQPEGANVRRREIDQLLDDMRKRLSDLTDEAMRFGQSVEMHRREK
jgi:hypothetical protein